MNFDHDETARSLWAAVLTEPRNGLAKMILADRCDELGLSEWCGYTLRWAGTRGHSALWRPVWPADSPASFKRWVWECGSDQLKGWYHLPPLIYSHLSRPSRLRRTADWLWYSRDPWEPYLALSDALQELVSLVRY